MTQLAEALAESRAGRSRQLAEQADRNLESILRMCDSRWFDPGVLRLHEQHRPAVLAHLERNWGLAKTINELLFGLASVVSGPEDLDDPTLLSNIATLLSVLMERYAPALAQDQEAACRHLEAITQRVVADLVRVAGPQVECLLALVRSVRDWISARKGSGRVVVPEFPVGNSIPVKLLARLLRDQGLTVDVPRMAMSRSDTGGSGVGARNIIGEELGRLALKEGHIVVYIDEWSSGANFETLVDAIARATGAIDVTFLPVAMLTDRSPQHEKYRRRAQTHDALLARVGLQGEQFRRIFPPLPSRFPRAEGMYFFWSEHDRTAGYRKMQIQGSLLSSIEAAVQELVDDEQAFPRAWVAVLERIAEQLPEAEKRGVSTDTMRRLDVARRFFEKSRAAYLACREELDAIEHPSNRGEVSDPEAALAEVTAALCSIVEAKGAKICVAVALAHLQNQPGIDPANRFFFKAHTPVIWELGKQAQAYHRHLMAALEQRLAEADGAVHPSGSQGGHGEAMGGHGDSS